MPSGAFIARIHTSKFQLEADFYHIDGYDRPEQRVGHEVLSLVQGVGRTIFSYP